MYGGTVVLLEADDADEAAGDDDNAADLETFEVPRPCYLADLRGVATTDLADSGVTGMRLARDGPGNNFAINGATYAGADGDPLAVLTAGEVYQWRIEGTSRHGEFSPRAFVIIQSFSHRGI